MQKLLHNNVAFICCNEKHLPQALFLNMDGNTTQTERTRIQLEASVPLKKNLWQQTIKAKINNQAALLKMEGKAYENILYWSDKVNSGDTNNYEARAAAHYWGAIFQPYIPHFTRGRFEAPPNSLLNYGYAILRAVVARSLTASGLFLSLGIHHKNKYNAFCLADDIMEPYRPFVDQVVLRLVKDGCLELDQEAKKALLNIPMIDVSQQNQASPLMVAMQQTSASVFQCMAGHDRKIKYPEFFNE